MGEEGCGISLKIKAPNYMLPWHSAFMPLPTLLLWIRSPGYITSFLAGTGTVSAYAWGAGSVLCQPTDLFCQSHPSPGTREHPHSRSYEDCFPQSLIVYSVPKFRTEWSCSACNILLPWDVSVCDQQIAVNLVCPVSGVMCLAIPRSTGQEFFFHQRLNRSYLYWQQKTRYTVETFEANWDIWPT